MSKKNSSDRPEQIFGIGFYRREQWPLLLETADDRKDLEDTYDEWVLNLKKSINNLRTLEKEPLKVDIDMAELLAWCKSRGKKNTGASRAEFITELLRQGRGKKIEKSDFA
jgi:hypothetical protein